jgi:chromosome segregation ATPase
MKGSSISWIAGAAVLAVFALRASVFGQTTPSNQDTLAALLVEVRGLRAAIEQMASAGPRVQLAFGRLQMQEQRVSALVRRADGLRTKIAETEGALSEARSALPRLQRAFESSVNADERNGLEAEVSVRKQQIAQRTADLQRLQMEESEASSQVLSEQSRWAEINQRLEDLERALAR